MVRSGPSIQHDVGSYEVSCSYIMAESKKTSIPLSVTEALRILTSERLYDFESFSLHCTLFIIMKLHLSGQAGMIQTAGHLEMEECSRDRDVFVG